MSEVVDLIQDLRAEAHRAPPDIADLMRRAADTLDRRRHLVEIRDQFDAAVHSAPFPPPALSGKHQRPAR